MKNYRSASSKKGQTLVEYALILAFVSVVAIAVMEHLLGSTKSTYSTIGNSLSNAQTGGPTTTR